MVTMQGYYTQKHLTESGFSNKDFVSLILVIILFFSIVYLYCNKHKRKNVKIIEPYYLERYSKVPSKYTRFSDKNYDVAISFILLEDDLRNLKYKFLDLNNSLNSFKNDLLKQQAMNDIILMLSQVKSGNMENFNISKMQQAILEAGYGNIDSNLLKTALKDYHKKAQEKIILAQRIKAEQAKTKEKIKKDSKETVVFATDIVKELAEEEIEGFIENLSIIARIGTFVVNKTQDK